MTIYTVLAPPETGEDGPDTDRFVFIKEGFCWPAFFFAAIWFLFRRMWLVFVLYLVASAALAYLTSHMPGAGGIIVVLFAFLVALEANNLRLWTLERRGYHFAGVAAGHRQEEAEFRFFSTRPGLRDETKPAEPPKPTAPAKLPPIATGEIIGLFPRPGGTA